MIKGDNLKEPLILYYIDYNRSFLYILEMDGQA